MSNVLSGEWVTNGVSIAAFVIFVGFIGKQVIDWFRGHKQVETEFRSTTVADAIQGHEVLKGMFNTLKEQVEGLESDLNEAKEREAKLVAKHEREIAELRRYYESRIQELRDRITELETRLDGGSN